MMVIMIRGAVVVFVSTCPAVELTLLALPLPLPAPIITIILAILVMSSMNSVSVLHTLWTAMSVACRNSQDNLVSATHLSVVACVLRRKRHHRCHVVVHVLSGGKTKIVQCGVRSTVGAMREA
eukprot:CAMPEP_0175834902 /NCGR_PEP_ID=MMETSP0107_2-20121207/16304_1 /TAXON_ID=195067 ORGANISM="Goniomonas pacifica, Strain CCMP1869" /NCGR_SAMPLE_ID=MMETSP0107_2 /ASSEMBLY_ACC=CAM_ASM_000203 /LENGTH=122 /DNA_ID=CAMNT_0017148155 /DNA_START=375 /DNA_END=739 /DNA_ORIENTATION=-